MKAAPAIPMTFKVQTKGPNSHVIQFNAPDKDWEQWVMLRGDVHHDSALCLRDLELQHLEMAKKRNAPIIDVGDLFDVMQGKFDPRKDYKELRPEYKVTNYLDSVLDEAEEFYGPYAENFALIAMGNHETELERRQGTNLTQRLVDKLRRAGSQAQAGQYTGYITFRFKVHKSVQRRIVLKYHHGMGGGSAPVTRGVIQSNRMAVMFPDARIIVSGHNHESWSIPIAQEKINRQLRIEKQAQWHIRVPSYKDGWRDGKGFDVEKGSPKPNGCVWLRFFIEDTDDGTIGFELTQMVR
ncbi:hypothetical protein LCGC14_2906680 [marine sediment metagenome]|uniref:Calcineurin-like phosphoesterase domain-containing protein n=1 Tax=marine sediment metagenome TaxID=412755 RepID=A0A0F9A0K8_9ZZZZ